MALPNLIIIGAAKAGTSSLHSYLELHPEIGMSEVKELDFFLEDGNWRRGIGWYEEQFDERFPVRGEASPRYTMFPHTTGLAERMARVVPDAKLIYLVRDPIDRTVSYYQHGVALGIEHRPIEVALGEHDTSYTQLSLYMTQIEPFVHAFGQERILIGDQADLRADRRRFLRDVFAFAGVDAGFDSPGFDREWETAAAKSARFNAARRLSQRTGLTRAWSRMPQAMRQRVIGALARGRSEPRAELPDATRIGLARALAPDIARFREFTGRTFADWSV